LQSNFVEEVQRARIKQPTQNGFSPDDWVRSYQDANDGSDSARQLKDAGLWVFERLQQTRGWLAALGEVDGSSSHVRRLLVGIANRTMQHTYREVQQRITQHSLFREDFGKPVDDVAETLLDGIRYPVAQALRTDARSESRTKDKSQLLASVSHSVKLGILYDSIENLWAHCLWRGWHIAREPDGSWIAGAGDRDKERLHAAGLFRYQSALSQGSSLLHQNWRRRPKEQRSIELRRVTGIGREGKNKTLIVGTVRSEDIPLEMVYRIVAEELYMADILEEPLPKLSNLTAKQLLRAWTGLSPIARLLSERFPDASQDSFGSVLEHAPMIRRFALVKAVAQLIDVNRPIAEGIVDTLTLTGTPKEEIWFRPFVPVEDDKLSVFTPALAAPNLLRSIEEWLRLGGLDLGIRGPAFEQHVRSTLASENEIPDVYVHKASVATSPEVGDIDLWIELGDVIIVGETKCSLFPGGPLDTSRYERTLRAATRQARTKAEFVRGNLDVLSAQLGRTTIGKRVLPVAISNLQLGAGTSVDGVPIVDYRILVKYFAEGILEQNVVFDTDGSETVGKVIRFYESNTDAHVAIESYLQRPPQVTTIVDRVHETLRPLFDIEGTSLSITDFEVILDGTAWPQLRSGRQLT
jgi:hypothetical protein